jgi:hypothetical protein
VQLDAAGAEIETADGLLDRALGEVEPHERDEGAVRGGCVGERPVVRGRERRNPIVLVEAEDERPADAPRGLRREELVAVADHPVDVVAEMCVDVEDVDVRGQLVARDRRVLLHDLCDPLRELHRLHGVSRATRPSRRDTRDTASDRGPASP